jgi:hypothetical protein
VRDKKADKAESPVQEDTTTESPPSANTSAAPPVPEPDGIGPLIAKVQSAYDMMDSAAAFRVLGRHDCQARRCRNAHSANANAKFRTAQEHYRRTRAKLVEAYGGALPQALDGHYPDVNTMK